MSRRPECPRCGYDLAAVTASWDASCPLQGRCSECGEEFWWGEILRPPREALALFDYARRRPTLQAFIGSVLAAPFARSFWTQARRQRPPRLWRVALLASLGMLLAHALLSVPLTLLALGACLIDLSLGDWGMLPEYLTTAAWPYADWSEEYMDQLISPWVAACVLFLLMPCPVLLLFPSARAGTDCSALDVVRGAGHMALLLPLAVLPWGALSGVALVAWNIYYSLPAGLDRLPELAAEWTERGRPLALIVWVVLFFLWWWGQFLACYMRMPRPRRATAGLAGMSLLLTGVVCAGIGVAVLSAQPWRL